MQATTNTVNGVDVDRLSETVDEIEEAPDIASFRFRARNSWIGGAHSRVTIRDFYGGGELQRRPQPFVHDSDEPPVLLGEDRGANPVEYVLTALSGCLTTALVFHAALRGVKLDEVETELEGDIDVRGFLGLDDSVRSGYEHIRVTFRIKSDAPRETLEELVELAQKRSPVYDIVTNPVPVSVRLEP